MMYGQLALGFLVLIGGAELLVRGAVVLAKQIGISPLIIGMTIVALGTSAPELVVSISAVLGGASGLAIGNVVGSNIANVLLVMGAAAIIMPVKRQGDAMWREGIMLIGATLLFIALAVRGDLDFLSGTLLMIGFFVFLGMSYWRELDSDENPNEVLKEFEGGPKSTPTSVLMIGLGLLGLALGADLLITGGIEVARLWAVSEEVIGLTVFALGTSLPELAATGVAAMRGHSEVGLGNVVGSNLFNMLGVAGGTALVAPLPISTQILSFDIWVMLVATILMIPVLAMGWRMTRATGSVMIGGYLLYVWAQSRGVENLVS